MVHRQLHREAVVVFDHALDHGLVHTVLDHEGFERRALEDRLTDDHVVPADDLAAVVHAHVDAVQVHRAVVAAADVVFAAPDHLDGAVMSGRRISLGHIGGFHHVVRRDDRAPAKTTARHHRVQLDLLGRYAEHLGDGTLVDGLELRADPHLRARGLAAVLLQIDRAVQRLHGRVREVREFVIGLNARCGRLDCAHIGGLGHRAGLARELLVLRHQRRCGHRRAGVFPRDLQRIAALLGWPVPVGNHGHTRAATVGRDLQHIDHALHRLGRRRVVLGHLAAKARRAGQHRHLHVGQARVEAKLERAVELRARIEARRRLADNAELRRILQRDLRRHRQRHRRLGQFSIRGAVAARRDHAIGGAACRRIDLPALRRCRDQHGTRATAQLAVLLERVVQRGRTARHLDAEARVFVRVARGGQHAAHIAPVHVEFFGQRHRQCCMHALTEFEPVDRHGDRVVRGNDDERLRRRRRLGLGVLRAGQHRRHTQRQTAASQRRELQKAAAIERCRPGIRRRRLMLRAATGQRFKISNTHREFSGGAQASDFAAS